MRDYWKNFQSVPAYDLSLLYVQYLVSSFSFGVVYLLCIFSILCPIYSYIITCDGLLLCFSISIIYFPGLNCVFLFACFPVLYVAWCRCFIIAVLDWNTLLVSFFFFFYLSIFFYHLSIKCPIWHRPSRLLVSSRIELSCTSSSLYDLIQFIFLSHREISN